MENKSLEYFRALPKSDLHSHAGRAGNARYISQCVGKEIPLPPTKFSHIQDMQNWYVENIRNLTSGAEGQILRWKGAFQQAKDDNLAVMALLFSLSEVEMVGGMDNFMMILNGFHKEICPDTFFIPELTFDRGCDVSWAVQEIDNVLDYHYFKSLDICNDEFAQPIQSFKPLYRKAKANGFRLKAHVGEFGTADDVREAVEELELDEVNHGIAAANSKPIMKFLADHQIQLNICPSSNVMLSIVEDYKYHPIRQLLEAGIPVTINTDDLLIFNQSVSQDYQNLYIAGLFTKEELDVIRLTGLKAPHFIY
ncbi:MAG TPA: adenosine deaminase [Lachnospiraceae bacterium]|nr:adenosine deaminase [Lachnospiraceae bacterium]